MGLFDNKPLTEEEVSERRVCRCSDALGAHGLNLKDRDEVEARHKRYHELPGAPPCTEDDCAFEPGDACTRCGCVAFREARS